MSQHHHSVSGPDGLQQMEVLWYGMSLKQEVEGLANDIPSTGGMQ
jgi:hypothetical protein